MLDNVRPQCTMLSVRDRDIYYAKYYEGGEMVAEERYKKESREKLKKGKEKRRKIT